MFAGARRLLAAVTFGLISAQAVQAQVATGRITGRVLETASQGPLANVSVTVVGSTLGTYTRPDGGYVLAAVPAGSVKIRVARIGYVAKEVPVNVIGGQAVQIDVTLDALAAQLAAVVTTGYGTREARDRTGVVETVTEKTFNTGRIISPEQLIQAKVAGRPGRRQQRAGRRHLDPDPRRHLHQRQQRTAVRRRRRSAPGGRRRVVRTQPAQLPESERHREHVGAQGRLGDGHLRIARRQRRGDHHHQGAARRAPRSPTARRTPTPRSSNNLSLARMPRSTRPPWRSTRPRT